MTISTQVSKNSLPKLSWNPISWARWWITPRAVEHEIIFRERNIRTLILLLGVFAVITLGFIGSSSPVNFLINFGSQAIFIAFAGWTVQKRRIQLAGWTLVLYMLVAITTVSIAGYWSPASTITLQLIIIASTLIIPRSRALLIVVSVVLVGYTLIALTETRASPLKHDLFSSPGSAVISFDVLTLIVVAMGFYLFQDYDSQVQERKHIVESLEVRVQERTRDLEIAASVSRQITTVLDLDTLLQDVVEKTKTGFNLYHVALFLYDVQTDTLSSNVGVGTAGSTMRAITKSFNVSKDSGLVAEAARTKHSVNVADVNNDPRFIPSPYLPDTCSELAVPMLINTRLIGVLDFQSDRLDRFKGDDVRVMQTLAEQIAIAVENAHLFKQQLELVNQLRAVDQMKSQFLASMSHELRTPLNAILNFTEFMQMGMLGPTTDQQRDALGKTLGSGKHLLGLINDVLDMTKIQSGMMRLFVEENIDVQKEVTTVLASVETLFQDKTVKLIKDIDPDLPHIVGDKRRIRQILLNLLSNAAKFTEQGSVTLSVKKRDKELLFAVIDTGPGIAAKDQEMIFEPFRQTEVGIQHANGTGLGLPISRKLAEAHNGRLSLESEIGQGAAFFFTMPICSQELLDMIELPKQVPHVQ